jgi:MOSC domain-containing protein YiiM/ferredoxin-NADP reductase
MARSIWIPPPHPDPDTLKNPAPFTPFPLVQVRSGKVKKFGPFQSAIFKAPLSGPVEITKEGIPTDEHAYHMHGGVDKALLHYCSKHYDAWREELPASEALFKPGGFGENLISAEISEKNLCIGDRLAIGEVIVEVSEPRAPCSKLNHRFEVKDMAKRTQTLLRTGWLYRIIKPGYIQAGDMIRLLERPYPEWTIARIMYYLFIDTKDVEMMKQIIDLPPLGWEVKDKFRARVATGTTEDQDLRMYGGDQEKMDSWNEYRLVERRRETSRVTAFTFEAIDHTLDPLPIGPGCHVRLKLGGKLVRAYSVVSGDSNRLELGVALSSESKGGSKFLHKQAKVGDAFIISRITASFPLAIDAAEHIILSAGIGITAFLPAFKYLLKTKQKFHLHYAYAGEMPFASQIVALGSDVTVYDKSLGQRLNVSEVLAHAGPGSHIYTCGPQRLMDDVVAAAKQHSIPDSSIHIEQFTVTTSGDPFTVELKESKKTIEVGATQSLLDALRVVGMDIDSSCEVGNCGTCKVDVCSGRIEHKGTGLLEDEKGEAMLSCVSRGVGTIVLDL